MPLCLDADMAELDSFTLNLLKTRDSQFLTELFETTNPYLFRLLGSQKIFAETAEELIQDTWQVFFKTLDTFEGRSQIKTYLSGILINKLREHRRYYKKTIPEEDSEKIYSQSFTSDGWWMKEPQDPFHLLQSSRLMNQIEDCLAGLSDSQREAFVMKEIHQESTQNICNILDLSVTHLGVLIFRAKEKLRLCLEGQVEV